MKAINFILIITLVSFSCNTGAKNEVPKSNENLDLKQKKKEKELFKYVILNKDFIRNDSILEYPFENACDIVFKYAKKNDSLAFQAHLKLIKYLDGSLSEKYLSINNYTLIFQSNAKICLQKAINDENYFSTLKGIWSYLPDIPDINNFEKKFLNSNFIENNDLSNNDIKILLEIYDSMIYSFEVESGEKYKNKILLNVEE